MDDTMPVVEKTKRSISRRAVIVNGAVGAAAFWSVPIIESVTQRAAAQSACQPPASLQISGAAVIYTVGSNPTVFWAAFGAGQTTCESSPTVPNDSDFSSPVDVCGGSVLISGGSVQWNGATPSVDAIGCGCISGSTGCFFTATNSGISVTAAGLAADVKVLVFLFHNGTFTGCETFGSKGHWAIGCGSTNPNCAAVTNCIPPPS
jgi:hypothetical protein